MSTLAVWGFDTSDGAERGALALQHLPTAEREVVHDAALVSWVLGVGRPTTGVVPDLTREEALGEAFWGVLFGLIFFSPLLGAAVGSATGGLTGSLAELGIHDTFVNRVRDTVTPGTSALFLLGSDLVVDEAHDLFGVGQRVKVLSTRLSRVQEGRLRQVFVG
jgi:uncharacterized membrane protein